MDKLEEKLNKLIELGRKPRGDSRQSISYDGEAIFISNYDTFLGAAIGDTYSLNDLCSIDSGLRQFVVGNGLVKVKKEDETITEIYYKTDTYKVTNEYTYTYVSYRLMVGAIAEDKTDFLLKNIKVDDTNN